MKDVFEWMFLGYYKDIVRKISFENIKLVSVLHRNFVPLSCFETVMSLPVQFYFENGAREPTVILKVSSVLCALFKAVPCILFSGRYFKNQALNQQ